MACFRCATNLHEECIRPSATTCCCAGEALARISTEQSQEELTDGLVWQKPPSEVKDVKSTGRKRAAVLYPLDRTGSCEWRGLKFAGGGKFPVVGCLAGLQECRHHGPDKNTLNNEPGNVHRICTRCHNRWHTLNDPDYDRDAPDHLGHDPNTKATEEDIGENEVMWLKRGRLLQFYD